MSSKFYGKMWIATCDDLKDIIFRENITRLCSQQTDRRIAHTTYARLYVKYVSVVNALGDIYDQTLQVQKREIVKAILTAATNRMFELQTNLKEIEMSEFMYVDQTLIEQKLIPRDVELLTPFYYPMQRADEIEDLLGGVRVKKAEEEVVAVVPESQKKSLKYKMEASKGISPEEQRKLDEGKALTDAINLIISHEKARQSRNLLFNIKTHPKLYVQEPFPEVHTGVVYDFTFKADQTTLFPVKRTDYGTNFYKVKRHFDGDENDALTNDVKKENVTLFSEEVGNAVALGFILRFMKNLRRNESAAIIQRCYLRHILKKLLRKQRHEHMHDVGMLELRRPDSSKELERIQEMRRKRRNKKKEFDKAFVKACEDDKARILRLRTPYIMEDISDHIRYWFREMYDAAGDFDQYPPEIKGGSILIIRGETQNAEEFAAYIAKRSKMSPEQLKQEAAKEKKKDKEIKKKLKAEKRKKKQMEKQLRAKWKLETNRWTFDDARFITPNALNLESTLRDYEHEWQFIDEFENLEENPYMHWIQETNYADVHQALRLEVDKLLRVELELLRMALCKDASKKYVAPKNPKGKKGKKGRKKKGEKAMTMEQLEQLYDEFVSNNVIIPCPKVNLDDFIGDLNYLAFDLRNENKPTNHNIGEIKNLLKQWVFGLGDISTTSKVRSICLAGPPGCGKKLLAFGLIREMGAVLFNISPDVVIKFQSDMKSFMANLTKLSRILAPSVLFINNAHFPFIKKVTPDIVDQDPKLLGPFLPKFVKAIKPPDKVIIIGTSNKPNAANIGKMKKTFDKIAVSYGPDYNSTLLMWQKILPSTGVDPEFDYSSLARVTKCYQMKQILDQPEKVLTLERRAYLARKPLQQEEILNSLLSGDEPVFPLPEKEMNQLVSFTSKVNKFVQKTPPGKKDKK